MSQQKISETKTSNQNYAQDECILLSTENKDYRWYRPLEEKDEPNTDHSQENSCLLTVCVTLLVLIGTSWSQLSTIYKIIEFDFFGGRLGKLELEKKSY